MHSYLSFFIVFGFLLFRKTGQNEVFHQSYTCYNNNEKSERQKEIRNDRTRVYLRPFATISNSVST